MEQVSTGIAVGDLFRLVDVDPPNNVPGLPAGVDARLVAGGSGIKRIGWSFDASGNAPGLEATYTRHSVALWSGSFFYGRPPVRIKALVEPESATRTFSIRVYDVTNSEVIAEATGLFGPISMSVFDLGALTNVPAGEAVWEIQLKRPSGNANKINALLGFVQIEFE